MNKILKKMITGVLFLSLSLSVVGCAGGNEMNQSSQSTPESSQPDSSSVAEGDDKVLIMGLQEAYAQNFLEKNDLMHIAYYEFGKVEEQKDNEIILKDFAPENKTLTALDAETENLLKEAYYETNKEVFIKHGYSTVEAGVQEIEITQYLGKYRQSYVVNMAVSFICVGASVMPYTVGDIVFWEGELKQVFYMGEDEIENAEGSGVTPSDSSNTQNQENTGTFYSLEEAYENGDLSQQDLQMIADYHNNNLSCIETLTDEISQTIKAAWALQLQKSETNPILSATADTISLYKFYGTYNGCSIVMLDYSLGQYLGEYVPITMEVGGVTFHFGHPRYMCQLVAWKK